VAAAAAHLEPGGLLACEIGDGQAAVRRRFRLKLTWAKREVFIAERDALLSAANTAAGARGRPSRSPARQ